MTRARGLSAAAAIVVVFLVSTGCWLTRSSDDKGTSPKPQVSASPSPGPSTSKEPVSPAEREAADRAAIEQVWSSFWTVSLTLEAEYPPAEWPARVSEVAVDPIKAQLLAQASKNLRSGVVRFGAVVTRPSWQQPIASKTVASMGDCLDSSRTGTMNKQTGKKLTVGSARSSVRAFFVKGGDGKWRVQRVEFHVDEKC